ncbi:MAG: HAD-IA family hydrolase [Byssovorax sp.]
MLPPTAIAFDLDGTLIDSRGDIVAAMNHALTATGRAPLPGSVLVRFVGDGARVLCARAAQLGENDAQVDKLYDLFVAYYVDHPIDFTRWCPGAQEALDALAQMPDMVLAICTNKPRVTAEAVLSALGVRTRFRALVAGGDLPEKKPAPGPLLHVAKLLRVDTDNLVMVGDAPQDIECARRAKVRSVGVVSGFSSRERLATARPDVTLESMAELPEVIKRWREATTRITVPTSGASR